MRGEVLEFGGSHLTWLHNDASKSKFEETPGSLHSSLDILSPSPRGWDWLMFSSEEDVWRSLSGLNLYSRVIAEIFLYS